MSDLPLITILTLTPLLGGFLVMGLGAGRWPLARWLALACSFVVLALCLVISARFDPAAGVMQFGERHQWIASLAVDYRVGLDGLSLLLVLLTALVTPMAILASWHIERQAQIYHGLVLLLQAGLFGTFTALNFFHWFLFWELSLVPAFFLIRLWGSPARSAAATQFFVYTMVGSVGLLLAFLAMFLATRTFDFLELAKLGREGALVQALADTLGWRDLTVRRLAVVIFGGAFLGFAVKVPLIPFHTWLPATYAEAPTGVTMLLTGLMSKMGVYGFLRILLPLFPEVMRWLTTPLLVLAVLTIVASAGAALAQRDLKRMLAYSSINHLGYCLLGIFAVLNSPGSASGSLTHQSAALSGVLLQLFNHGLTAATLFAFIGFLENRAGGRRGLDDFGGLRKVAPVFCGLMGIAVFSSLGLPGLNGFISEFLIFQGAFPLAPWAASFSLLGLLLTAVFLLRLLQRVFYGPLNEKWVALADLSVGERALVAPPLILMLLIGVYPQPLLAAVNATVIRMLEGGG
ncbi:MAG TPA: NADH-quinone oxidoreductase subunit M [Candidatus Paceibacterota bacterium]|nr:NADH-quinone oxidoreductase subunit M [Candidatus Paceibacterota bacterium]